jgi:hypothetical protein
VAGNGQDARAPPRSLVWFSIVARVSEKIWQGYGMEADAIWALDGPNGHERAGCCISQPPP